MEAVTQWDLNVLMWIQEHVRSEALTPLMKGVSMLANAGWFFIVLIVLLLALKKTRKTGILCALCLLGSVICCNVILKPLVARIRPYDLYAALLPLGHETDFSFPSGHTNCAFSVAWMLLLCWREDGKRWIACGVTILAAVIAFSRLYLGVHYPTDVIAGMILPLLVALLVWHLLIRKGLLEREEARLRKRRKKKG